jgi:hypothetical protein
MPRLSTAIGLALVLALGLALPAGAKGPAAPATSVTLSGGCATAVYSWNNIKKAASANIEIRPDGVLLATYTLRPVGASGTFALPAGVEFIAGQHYTIFGYLADAAGRGITPSGAAWWGYC